MGGMNEDKDWIEIFKALFPHPTEGALPSAGGPLSLRAILAPGKSPAGASPRDLEASVSSLPDYQDRKSGGQP